MTQSLVQFIKHHSKQLGMTQMDLADRAGVGLRFIREMEQGKETLHMDKVNQVLALFGHVMAPVPQQREMKDAP